MLIYVCKKRVLIINLFLFLSFFCSQKVKAADDLYSKLKSMPGVYVKKTVPLNGFAESFEIAFVQPLDHKNPDGPKFTQRLYIEHLDYARPVVFETHGYDVPMDKKIELSEILNANQIIVEHRFFGRSKPKPLNWKYLTSWQAASDHHRIIKLLKTIYTGKWVSTGKSKGGMAALFHKFNYPSDLDASLVFVAPMILGLADKRFPEHISKLNGGKTKKKIDEFQINCLKRKKGLIKIASGNKWGRKYSIGIESAFEWSVIEFPNEFLWKNSKHSDIPDKNANDNECFEYLNRISPISNCSDRNLNYCKPLNYQQSTELGFYGYEIEHLIQYLKKIKIADPVYFMPEPGKKPEFKPEVIKRILEFLQIKANNIIYLYGENDIYTAVKIDPSTKTNSIQIIAKGIGHQFRIKDLSKKKQILIKNKLQKWLGMEE